MSVVVGTLTVYTETPSQGCRAFAFSAAFLQLGQGGSSGSVETHGCAGDKEVACVAGKGKAEHTKRVPQGMVYLWVATVSQGPKGVPG